MEIQYLWIRHDQALINAVQLICTDNNYITMSCDVGNWHVPFLLILLLQMVTNIPSRCVWAVQLSWQYIFYVAIVTCCRRADFFFYSNMYNWCLSLLLENCWGIHQMFSHLIHNVLFSNKYVCFNTLLCYVFTCDTTKGVPTWRYRYVVLFYGNPFKC